MCIISRPFTLIFKAVQTKFINYARKQIERSEMNEEIRLRTPSRRRSPIGSTHGLGVIVKRPSVGNILAQVPYLQQHLSEANLVTVCYISLKFSNKNTFNFPKEKYIRKSTKIVFQGCTKSLTTLDNRQFSYFICPFFDLAGTRMVEFHQQKNINESTSNKFLISL